MERTRIGFAAEEIVTHEPTRAARLKWVVVVDEALSPGHAVNAVACIAATTGSLVGGLVARGGPDADGVDHPGLPWSGCSVLSATAEELAAVRAKAVGGEDLLLVDMPAAAQRHRVYDDYLAELATLEPDKLEVCAISIVGPRNRVDKLVKRLSLLP